MAVSVWSMGYLSMSSFLHEIYQRPDFLGFVCIPLIAAFVGWATNWLAIKMTFWPLEFIGYRPLFLGWRGIVPAKAAKMAGIVVDNTLAKLTSLSELFHEMEPEKIAEHITTTISDRVEEYVDEIMMERNAVLWENLPLTLRRTVYRSVQRQLPAIMDNIVEDIAAHIEELVDLKQMVVGLMEKDPGLIVRIFQECGDAEIRLVINSGLWFGFLFGLVQMVIYYFYPANWILPFFGLLVGATTNWVALNLIFRPLEPVKMGPVTLQGLFLRRKNQVAERFSDICTQDVVNLRNLMHEVLNGPNSGLTRSIVKRQLRPLLDSGMVRTVIQLTLGGTAYADIKAFVADRAVSLSLLPLEDISFSRERSGVIHDIFSRRMKEMSNVEFQGLLRPAFEEDEWILIALGGVLGMLAGWAQWFYMFSAGA